MITCMSNNKIYFHCIYLQILNFLYYHIYKHCFIKKYGQINIVKMLLKKLKKKLKNNTSQLSQNSTFF